MSDLNRHIEGEFETIFADVKDKNQTLIVGEIYRVPNTNITQSIERYEHVLEQISQIKNVKNVIMGTDQNIDYIKLSSNNHASDLLNHLTSFGMIPTITKPTRITHTSATLVDNIYVKYNTNIFSGIVTSDISDHLPVLTCVGACKLKQSKQPLTFKSRSLTDSKITAIKQSITNVDWESMSGGTIEDAWNYFISEINGIINLHAPEKVKTTQHKHILREP